MARKRRMDSKRLRKMTKDPDFISGIYNYCDRWCEKCGFTGRCMVYAMETESRGAKGNEASKDEYWDDVRDSLQSAVELLRDMAAERGIDLESAAGDFSPEEMEEDDRRCHDHPLAKSAEDYAVRVDGWFKAHQDLLNDKRGELISVDAAGLPGRNPVHEAEEIRDALEVINWYQFQVAAKVLRALHQDEDIDDEDAAETCADDSAGSAKVALLGIDRSLVAWTRLREHIPQEGDGILDILVYLDRLRRGIEAEFPSARAFKRPGFDE